MGATHPGALEAARTGLTADESDRRRCLCHQPRAALQRAAGQARPARRAELDPRRRSSRPSRATPLVTRSRRASAHSGVPADDQPRPREPRSASRGSANPVTSPTCIGTTASMPTASCGRRWTCLTDSRADQSGSATWAAPPAVLRAIAAGAEQRGLPPPAALIGEWFGSAAVIAPSVKAVAVDDVFAVPPAHPTGRSAAAGSGYLSYPDAGVDGRGPRIPEAAGGWSDCVLRQDRDGQWWYESLSGAPLSAWVAECGCRRVSAARVPHRVGRGRPRCTPPRCPRVSGSDRGG